MDPTTEFELALPPDDDAPTLARAFVVEHASGVSRELLEDASLLVTEVVGNAVRHGRPDVTMRVSRIAGGLRIAVQDAGETWPVPAAATPAPRPPGGFGMQVVEAVAGAWGVTPCRPAPGKSVWFEVWSRP